MRTTCEQLVDECDVGYFFLKYPEDMEIIIQQTARRVRNFLRDNGIESKEGIIEIPDDKVEHVREVTKGVFLHTAGEIGRTDNSNN